MRPLLIGISLVATLLAAPMIKRDLLTGLEKGFASSLVASQMQVLTYPSGMYVEGYGVVFTCEANLSFAQPVNPFMQIIPPEMKASTHRTELIQLPLLREGMRQLLLRSAMTLDTLAPSEQIAVGVTITHQSWEDKSGFPEQIVMQGQKSRLIDAKLGKVPADSVIKVQEQ